MEGAQTEPLVQGKLGLGQTALTKADQQLTDFKGTAVAPGGDGMLHAGDSVGRVASPVDAVARTHRLQSRLLKPDRRP
jgi:hypothetical protein